MLSYIHVFGIHLPMYSLMLAVDMATFFALYGYYFRTEYRTDSITFNRLTFSVCLSVVALALFAFVFNSLFHSISEGKLTFGGFEVVDCSGSCIGDSYNDVFGCVWDACLKDCRPS